MPTQTSAEAPTQQWSIEDLYNVLMYDIEPELTTLILPELDEIYAHETSQEKTERVERYNEAFARFEQKLQVFVAFWKNELTDYKDHVLSLVKKGAKGQEERDVESIEDIFSSTDTHAA